MSLPGFTAEASVYKTTNHYRLGAKGSFLNDGKTTITPQGCGIVEGIVCGTAIAGATVLCTSACLSGPVACALCFTAALGATLFGFCEDCIPFDIDTGGNGGGSENPPPPPSPSCGRLGESCSTFGGGQPCCLGLRCSGPFGMCEDPIRPNPPSMPPMPDCAERGQRCGNGIPCCDGLCFNDMCF